VYKKRRRAMNKEKEPPRIKEIMEFTLDTSGDRYDRRTEKISSIDDQLYIRVVGYYYDSDAAFDVYMEEIKEFDIEKEFIKALSRFDDDLKDYRSEKKLSVSNYFRMNDSDLEKSFTMQIFNDYNYDQSLHFHININTDSPDISKNKKFMKLLTDISNAEETGIVICLEDKVINIDAEYSTDNYD